jgi:type III secretory pathway lipoprotein EscJ
VKKSFSRTIPFFHILKSVSGDGNAVVVLTAKKKIEANKPENKNCNISISVLLNL